MALTGRHPDGPGSMPDASFLRSVDGRDARGGESTQDWPPRAPVKSPEIAVPNPFRTGAQRSGPGRRSRGNYRALPPLRRCEAFHRAPTRQPGKTGAYGDAKSGNPEEELNRRNPGGVIPPASTSGANEGDICAHRRDTGAKSAPRFTRCSSTGRAGGRLNPRRCQVRGLPPRPAERRDKNEGEMEMDKEASESG